MTYKMSNIVKSQQEVEAFLRQFMPKLEIWGIFFINRDKNRDALKALGIPENYREKIIRQIEVNDYVETISDTIPFGDMWVFGKDVNSKEIYIKISMGRPNSQTICISFHEAEHPICYAFKDKEEK